MSTQSRIAQCLGGIALSFFLIYPLTAAETEIDGPAYLWNNLAGFPGAAGYQDGIGTGARLTGPVGVTIVRSGPRTGMIIVPDQNMHTIRIISPLGQVGTLAGVPGTSGSNDGPRDVATFNRPRATAVDAAGNVYVADETNHTVRKISLQNEVTTVAGQAGVPGYRDGVGKDAQFSGPAGLAVDAAGNIYVGDSVNAVIRMITPDGNVTTIAGEHGQHAVVDGIGSEARFITPYSLCIGPDGNLYVADFGGNTIRRVTLDGQVTTLAGAAGESGYVDGTASDARFAGPLGIAVDDDGILYVTEFRTNHTIRRITPDGQVTTIGGNQGHPGFEDGIGTAARFASPIDIGVTADGVLYVVDRNNRISRGTRFQPPTTGTN